MKLDPTVFTIDNVTLMFKALRSYCLFLLKEGNTEQLSSVVNCIDCDCNRLSIQRSEHVQKHISLIKHDIQIMDNLISMLKEVQA